MDPTFSREDLLRYGRHIILPEVGTEGQAKLRRASVLLVGAGGLGSPVALYLAASGIGRLGIVDPDTVDLSNLQRQVLYGQSDLKAMKVTAAGERVRDVNPSVDVVGHACALTSANALEIIEPYDLVIDGTDNFATRYLVNDACVLLGKPNFYGSIFRFEGQATLFCASGGPCYRCLYPEPPPPGLVPNCAEAGVMGVLPGIIGMIQATEAVKWILGIGEPLVGRLLLYDALAMTFREVTVARDPACPVCGDSPSIRALIDYDQFCGVATAPVDGALRQVGPEELAAMQQEAGGVQILDVREPAEHAWLSIPGSVLIPLNQLERRLGEVDRTRPVIVHCHSGVRSATACAVLRSKGFDQVYNLRGGIEAWIEHQASLPQPPRRS